MNKKNYIFLFIFLGFILFLAPIPFQTNAQEVCIGTNGACESKAQCEYNVELRCKLRCGTGSEGQDCKDTVNSIICVDVMWPSQTSTTIEDYIDNDYVPANQQDCAAGISIFDNENQCEQYCGVVCLQRCPDDMGGCGAACVSSMCSGATQYSWEDHLNTQNFATFAIDWVPLNPGCEGGDTTLEVDQGEAVEQNVSVENPLGETTDPRDVIAMVVRVALIFLGVITLIIFIISGIMMMTSGGNEERFKKARTAMVYAIIGLVIVLASYSILEFVFTRLLTATGA